MAEDAATVLEQFVQDVSNLPAEIAHLLEEIQAKDKVLQECRGTINARDNSIQKFIRMNGSLAPNTKEEQYAKTILQNYDRAQALQDEKVSLSEKAGVLLDRQIRRLDIKIRDLQNDGSLSADPPLPSLLNPASSGSVSLSTTPINGASTPLNPVSSNILPGTTLANSNITRLTQPQPPRQRTGSPTVGGAMQNPVVGMIANQAGSANSAPASPGVSGAAAMGMAGVGRQRESSIGSDTKRRRLLGSHHLGSVPTHPSNLARQSSLTPGGRSPKPGTPGSGSRAGSAGPRGLPKKALGAAAAGVSGPGNNKPATAGPGRGRKAMKAGDLHRKIAKKKKKKQLALQQQQRLKSVGDGAVAGSDEEDEEEDTPIKPGQRHGVKPKSQDVKMADDDEEGEEDEEEQDDDEDDDEEDDDEDVEEEEEEEEDETADVDNDDRKYCFCRNVSHGNMVACDNDDCPYEWFHWGCVGMTKEPAGTWYCPECRSKMA